LQTINAGFAYMSAETWLVLLLIWIACGFIARRIASQKEAETLGFWLGFLFGPIGIAIALGVDGRNACPVCGTRLNGRVQQCPQCDTTFKWENGGKTCTYVPKKKGP